MNVLVQAVGGNFFYRYFSKTVSDVLPRRFRRLLFVASALGLVLKGTPPSEEVLRRINLRLALCYRLTAMLFPITFGVAWWKDAMDCTIKIEGEPTRIQDIDVERLSEQDRWKLSVFFAKNGPTMLNYGSLSLMSTDIHDLFESLSPA